MTYNYPFNVNTKDYSELLIMPTDGRWDLIRYLKGQYSWRVQLWFPNKRNGSCNSNNETAAQIKIFMEHTGKKWKTRVSFT